MMIMVTKLHITEFLRRYHWVYKVEQSETQRSPRSSKRTREGVKTGQIGETKKITEFMTEGPMVGVRGSITTR